MTEQLLELALLAMIAMIATAAVLIGLGALLRRFLGRGGSLRHRTWLILGIVAYVSLFALFASVS